MAAFPTVADYQHPSLSPDDRTLAVEKTDPTTRRHTIWLLDVPRGLTSRLVADPRGAHNPQWSADGRHIAFSSNRLGALDVFRVPAGGTGEDSLLLDAKGTAAVVVTDWSSDGRLLMCERHVGGRSNLWTLPLDAPDQGTPLVATTADDRHGRFSPDMRWLAYASNESGQYEVYVRRFPSGEGKWQVSTQGGVQPEWRRDGRELFYLAPDGNLVAATITRADTGFETRPPQPSSIQASEPPSWTAATNMWSRGTPTLSRERQHRGREFRTHHGRAELAGTAEASRKTPTPPSTPRDQSVLSQNWIECGVT